MFSTTLKVKTLCAQRSVSSAFSITPPHCWDSISVVGDCKNYCGGVGQGRSLPSPTFPRQYFERETGSFCGWEQENLFVIFRFWVLLGPKLPVSSSRRQKLIREWSPIMAIHCACLRVARDGPSFFPAGWRLYDFATATNMSSGFLLGCVQTRSREEGAECIQELEAAKREAPSESSAPIGRQS